MITLNSYIAMQQPNARESNGTIRMQCPIHGGSDALCITPKPDGVVYHCHAGCDSKEIFKILLDKGVLATTGKGNQKSNEKSYEQTLKWLEEVWGNSVNTYPLRYYEMRNIKEQTVYRAGNTGVLRWSNKWNSIISAVMDGSNKVTGLHRNKLPNRDRKAYGRIRGNAIKLFSTEFKPDMAIAEGVETAMAFHQYYGIPCWSVICATGIKTFNPLYHGLPKGSRMYVAADFDGAGITAYEHLKRLQPDYDIVMKLPKGYKMDWNDML